MWYKMVWGVSGKIRKLVTFFKFLFPFTYYHFLLIVLAEKEWMIEKRQEYFQTQLLIPDL